MVLRLPYVQVDGPVDVYRSKGEREVGMDVPGQGCVGSKGGKNCAAKLAHRSNVAVRSTARCKGIYQLCRHSSNEGDDMQTAHTIRRMSAL